ncbi:regulatory protein TenI [Clostridium homopropionicum DSM 5847]|uniref:Regulatory protein TenI n=1 Tax=Clostridium homopropionicum DSM 5847 TaxID=1121318 RepID=A0A0L6Z680_9CLOT|nr:thiamine phosphate synthase [Clostridium homopropionicum]KOA18477.1 regulatory protein TenI [Clostridium homopropionicum DSM 5847]SFF66141.1 thiamine-phosphate pyrophosphorylase [Clostridium homopropionicum]
MLIYVTNHKLCKDNFFNRIDELAKGKPLAIVLREKDLNLEEYESLAIQIKRICYMNKVPLIINQNISIAKKLEIPTIHLSMSDLRTYKNQTHEFAKVGASVHSLLEAKEAEELGASYLIAGHIFPTDCKKGIPSRGLSFLKEVCDSVTIPVFAIGGITKDKVADVLLAGAKGVCIMSEAMTCLNPRELKKSFHYQMDK